MLQAFEFESKEVRCYGTWDKPIWIAQELCSCLKLQGDASQHTRRLDEDEKVLISIQTPGGIQDVLGVTEPGLYSLVLGCRKPIAKKFKRWITHEVLPAIRKTGKYDAGNQSEQKALSPLSQENRIRVMELAVKTLELRHDERLLMAVQSEAKNIIESASEPQENKLLSVTEWVGTFGYRIPKGKDSVIGRKVAARWRSQHGCEPQVAPKYVGTNHKSENIKVYPQDFLPVIVEETESYCEIRLAPFSEA